MALPSTIQAILTRFRGTNNNAYNATSNPLGLGQGGHRQNFGPRLKDTADVVDWLSGVADGVDADAQATAADRVQTGQDRTASAASASSAAQSETRAQGWADAPENTEVVSGKYSARHWAAKAAAWAAGVSLPAISAANALQFLRVKADGTGYETAAVDLYSASLMKRRGINAAGTQAVVRDDKGSLFDVSASGVTISMAAANTLGDGWYALVQTPTGADVTFQYPGATTGFNRDTLNLIIVMGGYYYTYLVRGPAVDLSGYAKFAKGAAAGATNLPIGSIVFVAAQSTPAPNAYQSIRNAGALYVTDSIVPDSPTMSGSWRCCGAVNIAGNPVAIFQRDY